MDLSAYQGQQAQLQIIDQSDGSNGWGHLIVDNPVLSDTKAVGWANQTGANLIVNGQVVRSATGNNSPSLDWASWNVSDLQGQQAQVQIVDQNSGGDWGHTIADNFEQADAAATSAVQRAHWLDYGADDYAAVTFNDVPGGKRIMIGWMNNWLYGQSIPTSPWRSAMTVPRQLSLRDVHGALRIVQSPVRQLKELRSGPVTHLEHRRIPRGTTALPAQGQGALDRCDAATGHGHDLRAEGPHRERAADGHRLRPKRWAAVRRPDPLRERRLRSHLRQRAASAAAHHQGRRASDAAGRLVVRRGLRRGRTRPHHRPSLPRPHQHRHRGLRHRRHGEPAVHHRLPYALHLDRPYLIAGFIVRSRSRVGQSLRTDPRPFVAVQWWPSADLSRVDPHRFKPHPPARHDRTRPGLTLADRVDAH